MFSLSVTHRSDPTKQTQERHHSTQAGKIGDENFAAEVVIRPFILQSILSAGFTVLWTDSDMVWLHSPLPHLPDMKDPLAVRRRCWKYVKRGGNGGGVCEVLELMVLPFYGVTEKLLVVVVARWPESLFV